MVFELNSVTAGTSFLIMSVLTISYSLIQLYLNWKQAKVLDIIKQQNENIADMKNMINIINDQATETKQLLKGALEK